MFHFYGGTYPAPLNNAGYDVDIFCYGHTVSIEEWYQ